METLGRDASRCSVKVILALSLKKCRLLLLPPLTVSSPSVDGAVMSGGATLGPHQVQLPTPMLTGSSCTPDTHHGFSLCFTSFDAL